MIASFNDKKISNWLTMLSIIYNIACMNTQTHAHARTHTLKIYWLHGIFKIGNYSENKDTNLRNAKTCWCPYIIGNVHLLEFHNYQIV